jgi:hypothetical protein
VIRMGSGAVVVNVVAIVGAMRAVLRAVGH